MAYVTVLDAIAAKLAATTSFTALIAAANIYTDRQALQPNGVRPMQGGLLKPFLVLTQPTEGDLPNNIPGRFYLYYFDCYYYDDKSRPFNTIKQAAAIAMATLNLTTLPTNDEAADAGGGSIVRRPSPGQGEETAFSANRLIEYYRITIQRKLRYKGETPMTKVTLIERPAGIDYEFPVGNYTWNKANNYEVVMLDTHAEWLKATSFKSYFKFEPFDENAPDPNAADEAFLGLKPGKEVPTSTVTATPPITEPVAAEGGNLNA